MMDFFMIFCAVILVLCLTETQISELIRLISKLEREQSNGR